MEMVVEDKRHAGMFKPGQSGNPSGRPKSDIVVKELAREHTEAAIRTLAEIAGSSKSSDSARVQACTALLDRGWGKAPQYTENISVGMSLKEYLGLLAQEVK